MVVPVLRVRCLSYTIVNGLMVNQSTHRIGILTMESLRQDAWISFLYSPAWPTPNLLPKNYYSSFSCKTTDSPSGI